MPSRRPACPDCGRAISRASDRTVGYCPHCREYTGQCGAGRRVRLLAGILGEAEGPSWRWYCKMPVAGRWYITTPDGTATSTGLCERHAASLMALTRAGHAGARRIPFSPPPSHSRAGRLSRAWRTAFGTFTPEELAENRARYLARKQQRARR